MENLLKEMIDKDHITNDARYNDGLRKLRLYGVNYRDSNVDYYLYCNGFGYWK